MPRHVDDLPPDTADKLREMQGIRKTIETLEKRYEDLREEVVVPMTESEFIVGEDGRKYRVSRVETSTPIYHPDQLGRLSEEQREAITETKIVGSKLKAEIQAGRIDPQVAMHLVHYQPKKPFPKFDPVE